MEYLAEKIRLGFNGVRSRVRPQAAILAQALDFEHLVDC